jgi:acyl carrier protein
MSPTALIIASLIVPPLIVLAVMGSLKAAAAERKFYAEYRARAPISDEEMIAKFFYDVTIAPTIPARVRHVFGRELGLEPERILPDDDFMQIYAEFDLGEIVLEVEEEFGICIENDIASTMKGSVRDIAVLVQQNLSRSERRL